MQIRTLGINGPAISELGLGCMGMSDFYGDADRKESIATIHAAMEAGITLLDTGDFYGVGHNELLIRDAIQDKRDEAFIAVKFGALRGPNGAFLGIDTRPASIKNFIAYSLQRLGTDYIDLYQPARITPDVPIEDIVGAIAELVEAGYVRYIGLSEAGVESIRKAHQEHPIAALQIEYSLISREIEKEILPTLRELGIGLTAYGVLSRGLLSGQWTRERAAASKDFRATLPRFTGNNLEQNLQLVERLKEVAAQKGATPAQIAIAWVASQGQDIVPLIGARKRERLQESLGALAFSLTNEDIALIEAAIPAHAVAGTRYDEHQMAWLDSEQSSS